MTNSRKPIKVAVIGFTILLFVIGVCCAVYFKTWNSPFGDLHFVSSEWKALRNCHESKNPRGQMIVDLERRLKYGTPRSEILLMLGPPDFGNGESNLSYEIGMWSGMQIDTDTFDLNFGSDGSLRSWTRAQH